MVRVELLCFGTELLVNKVNSNVLLIADRLERIGFSISLVTTVGDELDEIERSFREAIKRSDIVLTCGGLGPTFDDLTRECLSKVLKRPLQFKKEIFEQIQEHFKEAQYKMAAENKRQAYVLKGAIPIINEVGTAPGQIVSIGKKTVVLLPGPKQELLPMLEGVVLDYLKKQYPTSFMLKAILHVFGKPESEIDEKILPIINKKWDRLGVQTTFEILAHKHIIDVCVFVKGNVRKDVEEQIIKIKSALKKVLGKDLYGENEEGLENVVGKLLDQRKLTLSVAESCTGGLLASKITDVSGSSNYFKEGIVAYSNESKVRLLGVKEKTIEKQGAVSEETAKEMALGVLNRSYVDWAIAITGIAGPLGGTSTKPVGTVWFAIASKNKIFSMRHYFTGTREDIKEKSALFALDLLRRQLA